MIHTEWEHQVYVVGLAAAIPGAMQALDMAFPRDDGMPRDPSKPELVAAPLSASGELPATHYVAGFVVKESHRIQLEAMGLAATPGITYWRCSNPEGILQSTNNSNSQAEVGNKWGLDKCLSSLGLKEINLIQNN